MHSSNEFKSQNICVNPRQIWGTQLLGVHAIWPERPPLWKLSSFSQGFLDILTLFFLVSRPGWGKWYVLDLVTSLGKKHSAMVGKMLMNIGPSSAGKSFDRLHAWRTESLTWRFAKSTRIRLYRWTSYRSESCTERLWHPWAVPHV